MIILSVCIMENLIVFTLWKSKNVKTSYLAVCLTHVEMSVRSLYYHDKYWILLNTLFDCNSGGMFVFKFGFSFVSADRGCWRLLSTGVLTNLSPEHLENTLYWTIVQRNISSHWSVSTKTWDINLDNLASQITHTKLHFLIGQEMVRECFCGHPVEWQQV